MNAKYENEKPGFHIKADIVSRPNTLNGKYKLAELDLDRTLEIPDNDLFYLQTLRMKADLADKMIAEAESQGKDTRDPVVMKELGEQINSLGEPVHQSQSVMTAVFVTIQLVLYYGIAIGIWGLAFKNLLLFVLIGCMIGFALALFSSPAIIAKRTRERVRETTFAIGYLWTPLAIIIGVLGLVALVIRFLFIK